MWVLIVRQKAKTSSSFTDYSECLFFKDRESAMDRAQAEYILNKDDQYREFHYVIAEVKGRLSFKPYLEEF